MMMEGRLSKICSDTDKGSESLVYFVNAMIHPIVIGHHTWQRFFCTHGSLKDYCTTTIINKKKLSHVHKIAKISPNILVLYTKCKQPNIFLPHVPFCRNIPGARFWQRYST